MSDNTGQRKGRAQYVGALALLNIIFQLVSDVTGGKIIDLFGWSVSVTVLYFPVTFIISDVLTEVYGYACARKVVWATFGASVLAGAVYQLAVYMPPSPGFAGNDAYVRVFSIVPRVLIGGWIAVLVGEFANNFVLARLKVITRGRYLWVRTIASTFVGQGANTALFYVVGLSGVIPWSVLKSAILAGWAAKVLVEVLLTPWVYVVVRWLKKAEGIDFYDRKTDFSPFILGFKRPKYPLP